MTSAERVEQSRARLRQAMSPKPPVADAAIAQAESPWLKRLTSLPVVAIVTDALRGWWIGHPMRPVAHMVGDASTAVARPLARSNPVAMVLIAAAVGAGLVWSRPWRWLFSSALLAGIVPQITSRVVASLPVESWLAVLQGALTPAVDRPGSNEPVESTAAAPA